MSEATARAAKSPERSAALFAEAVHRMPGGVSSPVRAYGAVGGNPIFIERGDGPYLWDVDGNRYIDLVLAYGPLVLGHRHPKLIEALTRTLERGTAFGAPTEAEILLAQRISDAIPSIEMVRFVNSGTEAAMSAVRLARGFTGRTKVIKFEGSYHGHADQFLVAAGSGMATTESPASLGVPAGATADMLVAPDYDQAALDDMLSRVGDDLAAIIVEPVMGNYGVLPPPDGWLHMLRDRADQFGALLIFDEVITGFRLGYGGAQEYFGVPADLTCLGKIIGGGLPVAAYGGPAEIMRMVAPAGPVYQAGTLSGNPLAMAAGIATLDALAEEQPYLALEERMARLLDGWLAAAQRHGLPATATRVGSMATLFFTAQPVRRVADARTADRDTFAAFHRAMLGRGVNLAPSQFEAIFLSAAHDEAVVDALLAAGDAALAVIAAR